MGCKREKNPVSSTLTSYPIICSYDLTSLTVSCFPHIVHLACGEIMAGITDLKYAVENAPEYEVNGYDDLYLDDFIAKDVIASIRVIVNKVNLSQVFSE